MIEPTSSPPQTKWLRFRFSLRLLLVAMLVLGLSLGWYGKEWTRLRQQRAIAERFKARNGYVDYDPKLPSPNQSKDASQQPLMMRAGQALFGDDAFAYIDAVWLKETNREDLEILSTLPKLRGLLLTAPPDDGFELIAYNKQLQSLTIRNRKLSPSHYAQLKKLPQLTELFLGGKELDDQSLEGLGTLQKLEDLYFNDDANLTSQAMHQIAELGELRSLTFEYAPGIGDDAIPHLQRLKKLHRLGLFGTSTTNAAFVHLREMKQLRSLWLDHSPITDSGFEELTDLPLTELAVFGTQVGSQSLPQIAKIRTLQKLHLGGRTSPLTDMDLIHLAQLTELRDLSISTNSITDAALTHLESLKNLRTLYLNSKATTRKAAAQLQTHLPHCTINGQDAVGSYELPALAP